MAQKPCAIGIGPFSNRWKISGKPGKPEERLLRGERYLTFARGWAAR
jgi:hypothetical protein